MSNQLIRRLQRVCGAALSISIIAVGLCLAVQCLRIYAMGDHSFSREAVAAALAPIRVPAWVCLGLTAAASVLQAVLPSEDSKLTQQEIALLKKATKKPEIAAPWGKYAVLALALALLIYGFATGGAADVLTKAVNICTECIGLG